LSGKQTSNLTREMSPLAEEATVECLTEVARLSAFAAGGKLRRPGQLCTAHRSLAKGQWPASNCHLIPSDCPSAAGRDADHIYLLCFVVWGFKQERICSPEVAISAKSLNYRSLKLSSPYCISGLKKYSITLRVPVLTSTVTAIPGDSRTDLFSTRRKSLASWTRVEYTNPNFSS
jgi:hypothetical protein